MIQITERRRVFRDNYRPRRIIPRETQMESDMNLTVEKELTEELTMDQLSEVSAGQGDGTGTGPHTGAGNGTGGGKQHLIWAGGSGTGGPVYA